MAFKTLKKKRFKLLPKTEPIKNIGKVFLEKEKKSEIKKVIKITRIDPHFIRITFDDNSEQDIYNATVSALNVFINEHDCPSFQDVHYRLRNKIMNITTISNCS